MSRRPNFIRQHCTELFYDSLPIIQAIIHGGLAVSDEAAKALKGAGVVVPGEDGRPLMLANIRERLQAIEILAKTGPGYRTGGGLLDGGEGASRGVVLLTEWEDVKALARPAGELPAHAGDSSAPEDGE